MSEIILIEKDKNSDKYDEYSKKIISMHGTLCNKEISTEFIEESLDLSDFLFIHKYGRDIRGFACVVLEETPEKHLFVNVICNIALHSMILRSVASGKSRLGGQNIIHEIIKLGEKLKVKLIKLDAIPSVISYYSRIGFVFENDKLQQKDGKQSISKLRKLQLTGNKRDINKQLDFIVTRYYHNFYNETTQTKIGAEYSKENRTEIIRDKGISMIFKLKSKSKSKSKSGGNRRKTKRKKNKSITNRKSKKNRN